MTVISLWPTSTAQRVVEALGVAAAELSGLDARVEHYQVPQGGYAALTGHSGSEVFSLEARLGPAYRMPGHSMWAVFQVFDPEQPNLALVRMMDRNDDNSLPVMDRRRPVYGLELDIQLCEKFIPVCNRVLNELDPTGRGRSQHVDTYHGHVPLSYMLRVPTFVSVASGLFRRFREEGQSAIILADFHDPLAVPVVNLIKNMLGKRDRHFIPRTSQPSGARVLLRSPDGSIYQFGGMSTAVDQGIGLARRGLAGSQAARN
ncbi:hypothetical protein [Streptomyces albireticuli]|uniref:Uncharacterized protein n=1 Tax=Streptomyces albireticuli TaxID=1940 RepID=A0A2A2D8N4_9ACTN|nr:hypothetical protein [Streptomyces albireticuli]MCD9193438.1 hypothetical protein [Streptomyces albireticuli]PAU47875.1 hypothetical protein CK936_16325 [Streptomyces albireticuli]